MPQKESPNVTNLEFLNEVMEIEFDHEDDTNDFDEILDSYRESPDKNFEVKRYDWEVNLDDYDFDDVWGKGNADDLADVANENIDSQEGNTSKRKVASEEELKDLVSQLNDQQQEAALTTEGPVMVVAGAGTGKTATLIHRVAVLMAKGVEPANILVVTFTDKAANEIKSRLVKMPAIGEDGKAVTAGTFHSVIFRHIIKAHPESAYLQSLGYEDSTKMVNLDGSGSLSLWKETMSEMDPETQSIIDQHVSEDDDGKMKAAKGWSPKDMMSSLSLIRAYGHDYKSFRKTIDPTSKDAVREEVIARIWKEYTRKCIENNRIDFDDILVVAKNMILVEPDIARGLARKWRYIHLDEYQDTNQVQMEIMDSIAFKHPEVFKEIYGEREDGKEYDCNVFAVGDVKQGIYAWRGSDKEVILNMKNRHPNVVIREIKYNYRSDKKVIEYANKFTREQIREQDRLDDGQLIAMRDNNAPVPVIVEFENEYHEAETIVSSIARDIENGASPGDFACLYRSRASNKALQKFLADAKIDFHVVNDTSLFDLKEVKATINLLRFLTNTWDTTSGIELLKFLKMGQGISSDAAQKAVNSKGVNVFEYLKDAATHKKLQKNKASDEDYPLKSYAVKIKPFIEMVEIINLSIMEGDDPKNIREYLTVFWNTYMRKKAGVETSAKDEVTDAVTSNSAFVIDRFCNDLEEGIRPDDIIDDLGMMMDKHNEENDNKVQLMTIHASKGLEFKNVFIVGIEEDFNFSKDISPEDLAQEKNVHYVAVTRAEEKLVMSYARHRNVFGKNMERKPHPILQFEIDNGAKVYKPKRVYNPDRAKNFKKKINRAPSNSDNSFSNR